MFVAIYQGTVVHDANSAVHVTGQFTGPEPTAEEEIKEAMVRGLIERDLPREWNWSREKVRVLDFTWTDLPDVPEDIQEGN